MNIYLLAKEALVSKQQAALKNKIDADIKYHEVLNDMEQLDKLFAKECMEDKVSKDVEIRPIMQPRYPGGPAFEVRHG